MFENSLVEIFSLMVSQNEMASLDVASQTEGLLGRGFWQTFAFSLDP